MVRRLARDELGIGRALLGALPCWKAEVALTLMVWPDPPPGVAPRTTHDRHLAMGVYTCMFIGDARPEPAQAVMDKLMDKPHGKGRIPPRSHILSGPQIRCQLLRCCVSTRGALVSGFEFAP